MPDDPRTEKTRARVLKNLDDAWQEWQTALAAVPEEALTTAPVVEEWTARDLINHVTVWEREFLKALDVLLAGRRMPLYSRTYGGIDAFNARQHEAAKGLSLPQLHQAASESHAAVVETLSKLPGEALSNERVRRRLRNDTYGHYREHIEHLRAWLEKHAD